MPDSAGPGPRPDRSAILRYGRSPLDHRLVANADALADEPPTLPCELAALGTVSIALQAASGSEESGAKL